MDAQIIASSESHVLSTAPSPPPCPIHPASLLGCFFLARSNIFFLSPCLLSYIYKIDRDYSRNYLQTRPHFLCVFSRMRIYFCMLTVLCHMGAPYMLLEPLIFGVSLVNPTTISSALLTTSFTCASREGEEDDTAISNGLRRFYLHPILHESNIVSFHSSLHY